MSRDLIDYSMGVLSKEWDHLQSHIARFDTIVFGIRAWAVSAFTGLLALSASQKLPVLMLLAILPVSLFWIMDGLHKGFQHNYIRRSREIEQYLASPQWTDDIKGGERLSFKSPLISVQFDKGTTLQRLLYHLRHLFIRNVLLLYGAMLVLCIGAYFVLK